MASVNKVILVGNLGRDPESRHSAEGNTIVNVSLATTDTWRDKATGEKKEATEWHRLSFFGKLAEIAGQYLKKGSQIYVEGRLRTRKWQDKEGQERQTTEIVVDEMKMLGGRQGQGEPSSSSSSSSSSHGGGDTSSAPPTQNSARTAPAAAKKASFEDMDDDIPF